SPTYRVPSWSALWCVLLYVLLRSGRRSLSSTSPCAPQRNAQARIAAERAPRSRSDTIILSDLGLSLAAQAAQAIKAPLRPVLVRDRACLRWQSVSPPQACPVVVPLRAQLPG